jgi:glycosyltransferase involved in cell wall biosynthesis
MKPHILWFLWDWSQSAYRQENDLYGGIGYYRVIKPAQILREWFDIDIIGAEFRKWGVEGLGEGVKYQRLAQYDLVITKHLKDAQTASNLLAAADYYKKKLVVDVDDNYFEIRKDNPALKDYGVGQNGRYHIGALLSLASGLTTSTEPLRKTYKKLNKHIDVLPNCNDVNDWPNVRKMWDDGQIRIGFAGGQGHLDDLELILEPMAYILAKYPNVSFEILSAIFPAEAMSLTIKMNEYCKKDISKQVKLGGGTMAWAGYPEFLSSLGWDIVLAPAIDDEFNRGKSHNRWMESSMIRCPVVASPVYPYKEPIQGVKTIQDGITGLFASNSMEWFKQLERLVQSKDLRRQIADNAYDYIKDNWQWEQHKDKFKKVISKYL